MNENDNKNEKREWHAPVFRSLDVNKTAQADGPVFTTDDASFDNGIVLSDGAGEPSGGPSAADNS